MAIVLLNVTCSQFLIIREGKTYILQGQEVIYRGRLSFYVMRVWKNNNAPFDPMVLLRAQL